MTNLLGKRLLFLGVTVILVALCHHNVDGKPALGDDIDDRDYYRAARRSPPRTANTYPPFPGDDDDYERYLTEAPSSSRRPETSEPWLIPTTLVYEYTTYSENDGENGYGGNDDDDDDEGFHKKIVPWFQRQWGKARDFVRSKFN